MAATLHSMADLRDVGRSRYGQVAQSLRERIRHGEWVPGGSALPCEETLAAQHGVAVGTVRRALQALADEGLIQRVQGRGTFVHAGLRGASMLRFFRFRDEGGALPRSSILSMKKAIPPAEVLTQLDGDADGQALRLVRTRSFGDVPCLHETIWLPLPPFEPLWKSLAGSDSDLLYPLYARLCGVHVHRAVDAISFAVLSAAQARPLRLGAGHPCALVQRRAFDIGGRCVEVRSTRGDANAFHYRVNLN